MNLDEIEKYRRAVRHLRNQARINARRKARQGVIAPAVIRAGIGDEELALQYLATGCCVGDIVVCRTQGMDNLLRQLCGFDPVLIAFGQVATARMPRRIVGGAPRTVFVLRLEEELAAGRGCEASAIERIDADEFVYLS